MPTRRSRHTSRSETNTVQRRWITFSALLLGVSAGVAGVAALRPFAPSAPAAVDSSGGDVTAGADAFVTACAGCHGAAGSGGGVGPALAGTGPRTAAAVAGVIASGRGAMPPGLVSGADAANVAAYVALISDDGAAPTTSATTATAPATAPSAPTVPTNGGTATFAGRDLTTLTVALTNPAPRPWTVWLDGPAGRRRVAAIAAGADSVRIGAVAGGPSVIGRYDTVLIGADPTAPALRASLAADRARDLRALYADDPGADGGESVMQRAQGQVEVLHDHVRFLQLAERQRNQANVRFHCEHLVNISRGDPARDLDANGDPSNPGDGVGLIGTPDAYLPRIAVLSGGALDGPIAVVTDHARDVAEAGRRCATTTSVAAAAGPIAAITAADRAFDRAWGDIRTSATETLTLEASP